MGRRRMRTLLCLATILVVLSATSQRAESAVVVKEPKAVKGTPPPKSDDELPNVPENVKCFHELESKKTEEQNNYETFIDEADVATAKLKHAKAIKKIALERMKDLESDTLRDKGQMEELKAKYKKEHLAALNVYELARLTLNRYNDLRKQASIDDSRSQQAMTAYLKYKELVLKVKAAAEAAGTDPTKNADFKSYTQMAQRYLQQYQSLQKKIKDALAKSDENMEKYKVLSAKYKKLGVALKVTDSKVIKATKTYNDSNDKFRLQRSKYNHAAEQTESASQEYDQKYSKAMAHKEKWNALKTESHRIHKKWHNLDERAKQYGKLKVSLIEKQAKYRSMIFKFTQGSKANSVKAEENLKLKQSFKLKYDAAHAAQFAFSEAYKNGGCGLLPHQIAALKAHKAEKERLKQAAAQAVKVAEEELEAAQEMREEAEMGSEMKQQDKTRRELRESQDTNPQHLKETKPHHLQETKPQQLQVLSLGGGGGPSLLPPQMKLEVGSSGSASLSTVPKSNEARSVEESNTITAPRTEKEQDLSEGLALVQLMETNGAEATAAAMLKQQKKEEKSDCDHDREVATTNFNAAEDAKLLMERHSKAETKHRKIAGEMRDGAQSAKNVLASIKLKSAEAKKNEERALQLRSAPCGALTVEEEWDGKPQGDTGGGKKGTPEVTSNSKDEPSSH